MFLAAITNSKAIEKINRFLSLGDTSSYTLTSGRDGEIIQINSATSDSAKITLHSKAYSELTSFFVNAQGETSDHVFQRLRKDSGEIVKEKEITIVDSTDKENIDSLAQSLIEESAAELHNQLNNIEALKQKYQT